MLGHDLRFAPSITLSVLIENIVLLLPIAQSQQRWVIALCLIPDQTLTNPYFG